MSLLRKEYDLKGKKIARVNHATVKTVIIVLARSKCNYTETVRK